jgi:hypothetical protein
MYGERGTAPAAATALERAGGRGFVARVMMVARRGRLCVQLTPVGDRRPAARHEFSSQVSASWNVDRCRTARCAGEAHPDPAAGAGG